ncbi:DNA replication/repair protein RecF [Sphingobacteriales bacterium UPWRP_1]|nr:hypothetical protein B6N25_02405 [Sphingobacteriales bacterium TSM_CSS]PSJ75916.1 DNA replication/repair protein RecF [Sphingobacteriales bacterium UPWRP_1]
MYLQQLNILNFKNYGQCALQFLPRINLVCGQNGAGKTNLLDAVYYLCFCKSYFSATDAQNIHHGQDFFRLEGRFILNTGQDCTTLVKYGTGRKKEFSLNGTVYDRLSEHIGLLPLVMIAPDDTEIIKNSSEERRKLLDITISQIDKNYLQALILYNKTLQQRNALLKNFAERNYFNAALLETYNEQLAQPAMLIFAKRQQAVQLLLPLVQQFYNQLSGGRETVYCTYQSALEKTGFDTLLKQNLPADRQLQRTTEGIHRDDVDFTINNYPLKKFGSQGQQKSFLIALKLAIFRLIAQSSGKTPIILLDDIFDKLDQQRITQLVQIITGPNFGQVFISDTQQDRMQAIFTRLNIAYQLYSLHNGQPQLIT